VVRSGPDDGTTPVIVVHGGLDRSDSFGRVARRLPDVPLIRYDRRGYGGSVGLGPAPLAAHVDDLLELADGSPVVVFGHSVGAVVALTAAQRRPDLIRAVLAYEPPTPWAPWWPRRGSRDVEAAPTQSDETSVRDGTGPTSAPDPDAAGDEAERFMRRMIGDRIWERLPARTRAARRAEGGALQADLRAVEVVVAPFDAVAIAQPVLAATGTATTWWHRRAVEELAAALPRGELVEVPGGGHGIHLTHPSQTADLVRRALAIGHLA
jgi:pimeloyl-ACP methyl ester carboxylesterase